jgi:hypothetical protein
MSILNSFVSDSTLYTLHALFNPPADLALRHPTPPTTQSSNESHPKRPSSPPTTPDPPSPLERFKPPFVSSYQVNFPSTLFRKGQSLSQSLARPSRRGRRHLLFPLLFFTASRTRLTPRWV